MVHEGAILALYTHVDDLLVTLRRLQNEHYQIRTVFSPIPLTEVQELLNPKTNAVRFIVLLGAILGGSSLVGLAAYAHLSYNLITGGKPVLPWVAWVIVCFEGMVLGGVVAAALSWILKGRLPRLKPQDGYDGAFSRDHFGIMVECAFVEQESLRILLEEEGAEEVRYVP